MLVGISVTKHPLSIIGTKIDERVVVLLIALITLLLFVVFVFCKTEVIFCLAVLLEAFLTPLLCAVLLEALLTPLLCAVLLEALLTPLLCAVLLSLLLVLIF